MTHLNFISKLVLMFLATVAGVHAQADEIYSRLETIKMFESKRPEIESLFDFKEIKESSGRDGFLTVYYELDDASISVGYSTGRCAERRSSMAYDLKEATVVRISVDYNDPKPMSSFPFKTARFNRNLDPESNALTLSSERRGVKLEIGDGRVLGLELFPSPILRNKYSCNQKHR